MKHPYIFMKLILPGFFISVFTLPTFAQSEWRNWNAIHLKVPIMKKLDASVGHLRTYDMTNSFSNSFNQSNIEFSYDINKKWSAETGVLFMSTPNSGNTTTRFYLEGTYKSRLGDKITWHNRVHWEINSANETRFHERIVLSTRFGLRKRLDFLKLSPSIRYSLYYNLGGSQVQYYDAALNPVVLQSPNGFHRGRLLINFNSKITKQISVSLFYLNQKEFNFLTGQYKEVNYFDPVKQRIRKPFNDYNAIGVTLNITLGKEGDNPIFD